MITGSSRWYTVGTYIVNAVRPALTSGVGRAGQVPGEIAWDKCDCEGLLAVSVPRVYLSELFPAESDGPVGARCRAPYEVGEFTVSVVRCVPGASDSDEAPTPTELDNSAGLLLQDLAETMDAVSLLMCQLQDNEHISDYFITPAEAAGPEGLCAGFTLRVLVSLERL